MAACSCLTRRLCNALREAAREVEKIIMDTPGVQYVSTVMGYSMLSGVNTTYSSFFFISLKPWENARLPRPATLGSKPTCNGRSQEFRRELRSRFRRPPSPASAHREERPSFWKTDLAAASNFLAKNAQIFSGSGPQAPRAVRGYDNRPASTCPRLE